MYKACFAQFLPQYDERGVIRGSTDTIQQNVAIKGQLQMYAVGYLYENKTIEDASVSYLF